MIEAVCWDVRGVFSGRPIDAVARVAAEHDLDTNALFAAIFGNYHVDGEHSWHRAERGEISLKDAWAEAASGIGMHGIVVDADPTAAMVEFVSLVDRLS